MTFAKLGKTGLEYYPCRYGQSRMTFRGPRKPLDRPYVAFLGGSETFGLFVPEPFPVRLERRINRACVNLGVPNAGLDLYFNDVGALAVAQGAAACVVQVVGAHNLSNRFYSVHPRRNDRFLRASDRLRDLYPEVDFADVHFNRHLLSLLEDTCADRFSMVVEELQSAWLARMKGLLSRLDRRAVVLWFAQCAPPETATATMPLFITRAMLDRLAPFCAEICVVAASAQAIERGTQGMVFSPTESQAAATLPGPPAHEEAAEALSAILPLILAAGN